MSLFEPNNASRRLFRRRKAEQAWWMLVALVVVVTIVGLTSDVGADRVGKVWPAIASLAGPLAGVMLAYFGASAWEAKDPSPKSPPGYGYGGSYGAYSSPYEEQK